MGVRYLGADGFRFALCPHPRNVPDDILQSVKVNGGVVQVNFYSLFVHCKNEDSPKDATLAHVADHIQYIGNLIGWDHVGLGSDYDGKSEMGVLVDWADGGVGIDMAPKGLEDVSKYPDLFKELLARGVSDQQARKVAGGNILRVWAEVERVAGVMQELGASVLEDEAKSLFAKADV